MNFGGKLGASPGTCLTQLAQVQSSPVKSSQGDPKSLGWLVRQLSNRERMEEGGLATPASMHRRGKLYYRPRPSDNFLTHSGDLHSVSCMIRVTFAPSLARHLSADSFLVDAANVRQALELAFEECPAARGYVLDDQSAVRKHVTIFVNNCTLRDRQTLTDELIPGDELFVFQALSGG